MNMPPDMLWTALLACAAVTLDRLLGEPRRAHPLVGFGRYANWLEARFNPAQFNPVRFDPAVPQALSATAENPVGPTATPATSTRHRARTLGVAAWLLAVAPPVCAALVLIASLPFAWACLVHVLLLWFALGARSLIVIV